LFAVKKQGSLYFRKDHKDTIDPLYLFSLEFPTVRIPWNLEQADSIRQIDQLAVHLLYPLLRISFTLFGQRFIKFQRFLRVSIQQVFSTKARWQSTYLLSLSL